MCQAARQWVASSLAAARRSAVAALPFPLSGACQPRARSAASETNERTAERPNGKTSGSAAGERRADKKRGGEI